MTMLKESNLSPNEQRALFFEHFRACLAAKQEVDQANEEFNRVKQTAKADGFTLRAINRAIKHHQQQDPELLKAEIEEMITLADWVNVPVNVQDDLFADRRPAGDRIFDDGKAAGMAGRDAESGYAEGSDEDQQWQNGWAAGQEEQRANLQAAMEKKVEETEGTEPPEPDDGVLARFPRAQ